MFRPRYVAPAAPALTRALGAPMTRPQLCARVATLRRVIDELYAQAELDGHGAIPGTGALKVALSHYENDLSAMDRQPPAPTVADGIRAVVDGRPLPTVPFAGAVNVPAAEQRLRQAGADLSEAVRMIAIDGARAIANAAQRREPLPLPMAQDGRTFPDVDYFTEGDIRHENGEF
jgi:hypothetical protein